MTTKTVPAPHRAIDSQRHLFDIPRDIAWLNCAYMAPLMKPAAAAGRAGIDRKARPWTISPPDFFSESDTARKLFADLIGTTAQDVAIVPSASYGIATAAANLPVGPDQEILVLADQFPSNVYSWRRLAADTGAKVRTLERSGSPGTNTGVDWTGLILEAISERTAIVAAPNCLWTDGSLIDLAAVGAACRDKGAALVLDLTQSLGALPFDVKAVQPDFMIAATYKWLLGPYSLGFLYVAPHRQSGRPLEEGWIARAGSEDFARLVDYQDAYQPGALRFDMGERSNFHLLPVAIAALRQITDWQVGAIAETLGARNRDLVDRLAPLGFTALPEPGRAPHFLGLRRAAGIPDDLLARLNAAGVYISQRGDALRITQHVYNDDEDIDRLIGALETNL